MALNKKSQALKPVARTQNSYNGWKPKVTQSVILVCKECKVKYIKTREPQIVCIKCMRMEVASPVFRLQKD
ncbi:hypothetical protein K2P56_01170 [Patescibacteria group bacterium]|nr:hypothetical protein [Patescibacteria group bacterium]